MSDTTLERHVADNVRLVMQARVADGAADRVRTLLDELRKRRKSLERKIASNEKRAASPGYQASVTEEKRLQHEADLAQLQTQLVECKEEIEFMSGF